jgi:imidazolonepropionase-like amidohydrolase
MSATVFTNVSIYDGTGAKPFPGEVRVEGKRIAAVAKTPEKLPREGAKLIDAGGMTLMPGLIDGHSHLCFISSVDRVLKDEMPPMERHFYYMLHNAKTMLDYGFTSIYSGGAVRPALECALRDEIKAGWVPGPRLKASSFERSVAGERNKWEMSYDEAIQFVRDMIDTGVDSLKLVIDGHGARNPAHWEDLNYDEKTITEITRQARENGMSTSSHTFTAGGIKRGARCGIRVLYHCQFADEEAMDLISARGDDVFVGPTVGVSFGGREEAMKRANGNEAEARTKSGSFRIIEAYHKVFPEFRKRGFKLTIGGDYGFPFNPIGRNARDLEILVKEFGFDPAVALTYATKNGGDLMGMKDELGLIKEGYLADILLVDGDVIADIGILQNKDKLAMIMQEGKQYKPFRQARQMPMAAE